MHDDRVGLLVRLLRAGERAALNTLAGIIGGILIGDFRDRQALQADAKAGFVHHHEHGVEALVLRADEIARRLVVVHDAGRVAVNAHLVLDRAAGDGVAASERAIGLDHELRYDEQRDTFDAFRRTLDAGENQMHDIVGHVMLAGRDENLLAGNLVGAVALRHGLRAKQAEVGAAMGLREVHRAGPSAFDHLRQIGCLLGVGTVNEDRGDRALGQARIHGERHVGRRHVFTDGGVQRVGQALAAEFFRHGKAEPAAFAVKVEGLLVALRRRDGGVVVALAAFLVAGEIDREQHLFRKLGSLADDRFDHVGGRIGETGKIIVALDAEHVVQDEEGIFDRSLVDGHVCSFLACKFERGFLVTFDIMLQNFDVCVNVKNGCPTFCIEPYAGDVLPSPQTECDQIVKKFLRRLTACLPRLAKVRGETVNAAPVLSLRRRSLVRIGSRPAWQRSPAFEAAGHGRWKRRRTR